MTNQTESLNYYFIVNSGLKLVHFFQLKRYALDAWSTLARRGSYMHNMTK